MIIIIDNYDSFVFNLARYVVELGFVCDVYRNDKISLSDLVAISPSHIILSPGPCSPNEAGISLALVEKFINTIPLLGVCLGHQTIAQACGAKIVRAQKPMHGKADHIFHAHQGILHGLPNPLKVGRYHSLIVENRLLPEELVVTAKTSSGEIMAFQHRDFHAYGVQFHPESVLTEAGHAILRCFLEIQQTCRIST
jgi:anthranilate synthase/aminodeoxychorismate synthase-like glutamine amidotransferase